MKSLIFKDHREYVRFELKLRQQRRPSYSMRAMARDLRMSPSSLCDFLRGRVGVSLERATFMANYFEWPEAVRDHFWDLVQSRHAKLPVARKKARLRAETRLKVASVSVSLDSFKVISEWYHLVILEIHQILSGEADVRQISRRLGIPAGTVRDAIARLIRVGLLRADAEGKLRPSESDTWVGDEAPSMHVRAYHAQMLGLALKAVETVDMNERESLSLVFSIEREDFPKLHKEMRDAVMSVVHKYAQSPKPNQIQALTLQTFPAWDNRPADKETNP